MHRKQASKTFLYFLSLIIIVIGLSILSNQVWDVRSEKIPVPETLIIESNMTVNQFGRVNRLPDSTLKYIFELESKSDLEKIISGYGSKEDISSRVKKKMILSAEEGGKNWKKIAAKFLLWFTFLIFVFIYLKKRKVTVLLRNSFLFISLFTFGVILGSDPAPMGTIKDAVYLFAKSHTVFPPRMIALILFLLMVFLANKYICAWGCQAGTLQELVFRLNRDSNQKPFILKQVKLPFIFTNTFRVMFFLIFTGIAFLWGIDIIEPVDFFKVYNPSHLGAAGIVFSGVILVSGLFIYRPWCNLLCPFGLTGWILEKISRVRISVDYDTCIACKKCADACPSYVMKAILFKNTKAIPDCYACYTCRDVCPTGSIQFSGRKRTHPPDGHFDKKTK